ncbi:unnamed protein product [Gongylonema pulchrum]|uniref:Uncharacterized protein n=1 Tax=Gongylonema pulchrum TaxID=637853 RepID=A0A183DG27_9BILA|nr:unnamed protein product [Gongylonema pulchrum]
MTSLLLNSSESSASGVAATSTTQFLTFPFRRRRKRYTINPPDDTYHVVYLGNVLTLIAKDLKIT